MIFFFDLDGVIIKSLDIKNQIYIKLYKKKNIFIKKILYKNDKILRGLSRKKKISSINKLIKLRMNNNETQNLIEEFSKIYSSKLKNIRLFDYYLSFLKKIYKTKNIYCVSSSPEIEVKKILHLKKINKYFDLIKGAPTTKYVNIKKILRLNYINKNQAIYIGDTKKDYIAARKNEIDFCFFGNPKPQWVRDKMHIKSWKDF